MFTLENKARIRIWRPYICGFFIWLALAGALFYVSTQGDSADIPDKPVDLHALSNISTFCEAYINANGGGQELDKLQGILSTGFFESGGRKVGFRTIKRRPDKSITTLEMEGYSLSFIVNGNRVWQRVEQEGKMPEDTLKEGSEAEAMRELGHFFAPLMYAVLEERAGIVNITPDSWNGEQCLLVEINLPLRGIKAKVYIDPLEMTPIARIEDFNKEQIREIFYDDYRPVDKGIMEPFKIETFLNGKPQSRVVLDKCRANPGIVSSIFDFTGNSQTLEP